MIQKRIRSETENDIDTLPVKKCNISSEQKETFLFIYKRDHTEYISSDADIQSLDLSWKKSTQTVKITMHKSSFQPSDSGNDQLDENCCWEWLKKNVKEDIVKPYCPQLDPDPDPDVVVIEEDTPDVIILEDNRASTSKNDKNANTLKNDKNYDSNLDIIKLAIRLKQEGYRTTEIASRFRMKAKKLNKWILVFKNSNKVPLKIGRPRKLNQKHKDFITQILDNKEKPINSTRQIKVHLEDEFNLKMSQNTILSTIKSLGYRKKKTKMIPMDRNSERVINLRKKIVMQMISKWSCKKIPIFIDETWFQNSMTPAYSYAKRGEPIYQKTGVVKTTVITVILAITNDTLIGYQCFKREITASDFHAFLTEFLKNNQDIYDHLDDYVFVMDNSPIHKHSDHMQFRKFLQIIYLPPYSPFLNPIEEVFSQWKRIFREKLCRELKEALNSINSSFKEINYSLIPKVYSHSLSFYPKCLKCLPIE